MTARIDPDKIDQLVVAVLQAVDERLGVIRQQFQGLVDATNQHRADLERWQRAIEQREARLRTDHERLDKRLAEIERRPVPTAAAPAAAVQEPAAASQPTAPTPLEPTAEKTPKRTPEIVLIAPEPRPAAVAEPAAIAAPAVTGQQPAVAPTITDQQPAVAPFTLTSLTGEQATVAPLVLPAPPATTLSLINEGAKRVEEPDSAAPSTHTAGPDSGDELDMEELTRLLESRLSGLGLS